MIADRHIRRSMERWLLIGLLASFAVTLFLYHVAFGFGDVQFLWLADAFLHGHLDVSPRIVPIDSAMDMVIRGGLYYWPLGPLPAVLLMPAVALFGKVAAVQATCHMALGAATFVLAFKLARAEGFEPVPAAWLALALVGGSVMVGVVLLGMPWQIGNHLAATLLLAALLERKKGNRPVVIGAFLALALATRVTMVWAALFFVLDVVFSRPPRKETVRRIAVMAAPIAFTLLLLGAYDVARFGSPVATGQSDHFLRPGAVADARAAGVFSLRHVPTNFAWYFLSGPEMRGLVPVPDPNGFSAILLSPVFLWLAKAKRSPAHAAAAIAWTGSLAMYLAYFGTGFKQFGPRFLVDLLPLLYMVLLATFRERGFGRLHRAVIAASVTVNLLLFHVFALVHVYHLLS